MLEERLQIAADLRSCRAENNPTIAFSSDSKAASDGTKLRHVNDEQAAAEYVSASESKQSVPCTQNRFIRSINTNLAQTRGDRHKKSLTRKSKTSTLRYM